MKNILVIAIMVLLSCQTKNKSQKINEAIGSKYNDSLIANQRSDSAKTINTNSLSFLDSIDRKYVLSIEQIKNHTLIDSIYYTGVLSNAGFSGDTIFNFNNDFKGALIEYDDKQSCIYKFLLIFNKEEKNLSNMIVYTDCDQDESVDYQTLRYKLLNDSVFETIETYFPANSKAKKNEKFI
ncbi:MAG TPA: hypothetical protein VIJ95_02080 [Hanamia sp.]